MVTELGSVRSPALPRRALLVLVAILALVLAACGGKGPDQPQDVAGEFAAALASRDIQAAANLTDHPEAAAAAITQMFDGLSPANLEFPAPQFTVKEAHSSDGSGTFTLDSTWNFGTGPSGDRIWQNSTPGAASDQSGEWRITWNPELLAPGLTADKTLRYTPLTGTPAVVLDRTNRPVLTQQTVTLVNLDATANPAAVAALLTPIAPTITVQSLQQDLAAAAGRTVTAIGLRDADLLPIQAGLEATPGVTLVPQARLLTTDRALASPALDGVREEWQHQQDAAAGWAVQAVSANGTIVQIGGSQPGASPDIITTLDPVLQTAAQNALAEVPQQAAIVALQPSTGAVLAVAQNAAANGNGPIALTGLYPPGSTFKTVTTAAALQAGDVTPDTVLPCPGTENIEGRQIPNDHNFDLGSVPLHTAFARSCNTTMGRMGVGLPADGLQNTALQLGLGVDYTTPGLTTVTGKVPLATTPAQRVESAIGQGEVTASPFGMALVAASIAHGSTPLPMVIAGRPATADQSPTPVQAAVSEQIRNMMRETVTSGTATSLNDIPDLRGKTGTAEFGDNTSAHGWFVGIDGDLAFAVFVAGANSSGPAVEAAGRFLRPIQDQIPR